MRRANHKGVKPQPGFSGAASGHGPNEDRLPEREPTGMRLVPQQLQAIDLQSLEGATEHPANVLVATGEHTEAQ